MVKTLLEITEIAMIYKKAHNFQTIKDIDIAQIEDLNELRLCINFTYLSFIFS